MNANEEIINKSSSDDDITTDLNENLETFPGLNNLDKYYNCLCVVFNELISDENGNFSEVGIQQMSNKFVKSRIYSTKKAYCFMFSNSYY